MKRRLLNNIKDVLFYKARESYIRTEGSFTCLEILHGDIVLYNYQYTYLASMLYNNRYAKFW